MPDVAPVPDGYTAVTPYLVAEDAPRLIEFLAEAFGAVERMRIPMPDGGLGHAEVEIAGAAVMLSSAAPPEFAPTQSQLHLYVEDVDAVYERAVGAGGAAVAEPADQFYGDRLGRVADPAGNVWSIATHVEDVTPEQIMERMAAMGEG